MRHLLALCLFAGCATVTPGTAVLEVTVCGESAGAHKVIRGGRYWYGFSPCADYYTMATREQRAVWEAIAFAGKDGQKVDADVGVGFALGATDAELIKMAQTFGYDVDSVIESRVRDSARNALNMCAAGSTVDEIYGMGKEALFTCAEQHLQAEYNPSGLHITRLTLNSEVRLPESVKTAMEASTAATQHAERTRREVESTRAEGEKVIAAAEAQAQARLTAARAEAEANKILAESVTPGLIRLRELEIEQKRAEKWNGALPTVSSGDGGTLLIDVGAVAGVAR